MSSYINEISIYGLMNKTSYIDESSPFLSFYKTKDKSKIAVCRCPLPEFSEKQYKQINYMYLDEDPNVKGTYSKNNVLSYIDTGYFTGMKGNKYRSIRHPVNINKDRIKAVPLSLENCNDVIDCIERWRYNEGYHYRWQEHAGIDKALVNRYANGQLKDIIGYTFYYDNICVGYATISTKEYIEKNYETGTQIPEFHYITRKVSNQLGLKHLTEYIDWFMFSKIYELCKSDFIINWGCSDGGVYWYKTHKWPIYKLEPKWFVTIKQ